MSLLVDTKETNGINQHGAMILYSEVWHPILARGVGDWSVERSRNGGCSLSSIDDRIERAASAQSTDHTPTNAHTLRVSVCPV